MNGLKYIRIRCNYSQRSLSEALGVSRQAVNMWENATKPPSNERKEKLCEFFGIDNPEMFGELTPELYEALQSLPVYRIPTNGESERFSFKYSGATEQKYKSKQCTPLKEDALSLDDMCLIRRSEMKKIFSEFNEYSIEDEKKNSFNNLLGINRALGVLTPAIELLKESRNKHPEFVMIYFYTILSVLDGLGISFGTIQEDELTELDSRTEYRKKYGGLSIEISEIITKHLDNLCTGISTKSEKHENFRRRKNKVK